MIFRRLRKKISDRFHKSPKLFSVSAVSVAVIFLLGVILIAAPHSAQAQGIVDTLGEGLAGIILRVVSLLGKLLVLIIDLFINVAQYNNFIDSVPVSVGWSIVRDTCNMFFIVALLVIAFGTILKIERYRYNRLLVHLIIMAVLINFSKVIAGFFIDFGQVVMMTFVNAFKDAAAGNFTQAFRMREILELRDTVPEISGTDYLGAAVLALAMMLIALVVMIALLVVILVRIIMLWILVVLSPLAYLLSALPGAWQQQTSRWWSNFGKWVAIGPVLAFFVWLSLTVIGDPSGTKDFITTTKDQVSASGQLVETVEDDQLSAAISKASSTDNMLGFTLGISMLIMALLTAQQMGGVAGSFAGKALSGIQKGATTMTGARWAQDRWRAFQGQREQKRKEKAAKFGARAYGIYEGVKSVPGAGFKAAGKGIDYLGEKAGKAVTGTTMMKGLGKAAGRVAERVGMKEKGVKKVEGIVGGAAGWLTAGAIKTTGRAAVLGGAGALTGGAGFGAVLGGGAMLGIPTGKGMKEGGKYVKSKIREIEKAFFNRVSASMTEKSDYLDMNGKAVDKKTEGHYAYNDRLGAYMKDKTAKRFENLDVQGVSYDSEARKWQAHVLKEGKIDMVHLGDNELLTQNGELVSKRGRLEDIDNPDMEYRYSEEKGRYYQTNKSGVALDKDKNVAETLDKRVFVGTHKLPKFVQEMGYGWSQGRTQSWALRAKGEHERIGKEYQEMAAAGLSSELMHRGLRDHNLSSDARLARGMALAAKDGFKDMEVSMARGDVDLMKKLTVSNTLLAREFQENMYKRFAHLYHDLSTEAGRNKLKQAAAEGKVDLTRQDDSSLSPDFLKVMKDHFGNKYISRLEDTATTDDREKNIKNSLKVLIKELGIKDRDFEGKLLPDRVALANIAGDMRAFARIGKDDKGKPINDLEKPGQEFVNNIQQWLNKAKIEQIIKTDTDYLDFDPKSVEKISKKIGFDETHAREFITKVREAFGTGLQPSQKKSIMSSRTAKQEFKKLIEEVFNKYPRKGESDSKNGKRMVEGTEENFRDALNRRDRRGGGASTGNSEDDDDDEQEV